MLQAFAGVGHSSPISLDGRRCGFGCASARSFLGDALGSLKSVYPAIRMADNGRGLSTVTSRVARDQQGWRKWYKTARWVALRKAVLLRDHLTCARCHRQGMLHVPRGSDQRLVMVVNHVEPHRGVTALFWDIGNLETVCKPCHDSLIQREEIAGRKR
jgi:hypothetical protein